MKIFRDKLLTQEIEKLDLGIVPAGEIRKYTFWVMNDKDYDLIDLKFTVEFGTERHDEIKVISAPEKLLPYGVDELIIEYHPSVTLEERLKAEISIEGQKLI